jgi:hypothetical protein
LLTATLSLLLFLGASTQSPTQPHELQFTQILAHYHAASQDGNRALIMCLEPKFHVSKSLVAEYAKAAEKRRAEIAADLAVLERSSARCTALGAARK